MTTEHEASRTLVKSPPELWAECSEAGSLARHLDQFGEIRITRLEPETAVAWEGEEVSGTVRLEPSGWGTRVIMTARQEQPADAPEPVAEQSPAPQVEQPAPIDEPVEEPEPVDEVEQPEPVAPVEEPEADHGPHPERPVAPKPGLWARIVRMLKGAPDVERSAPEPGTTSVAPSAPTATAEPETPPELAAPPEPEKPPAPPQPEPHATEAALTAALNSLGQAHHRPYSRS